MNIERNSFKTVVFTGLLIVLCSGFAMAGDALAEKYGKADPNAPAELAQWMWKRGEWNITIHRRQEDGTMKIEPYISRLKAVYMADGQTFLEEFSVSDTFYSVQVRAYNKTKKKWQTSFINSKRQRWTTTFAEWVNGEMHVNVSGGYSGKEAYLSKELDTEITTNRFVKYVSRSYDNGKTWKKHYAKLVYIRAKSKGIKGKKQEK